MIVKNLIFTNNKQFYTNVSNDINWNYNFQNDTNQCLSYITFYHPEVIFCDFSVDYREVIECVSKLSETYSYSPMLFTSQKEKILDAICKNAHLFVKAEPINNIPSCVEEKLDSYLSALYFSPNYKGYNFIKRCIFEGMYNPFAFDNVNKNLYNNIAEMFLTTKFSVERAINFSIQKAHHLNPQNFSEYVTCDNKPPSNVRFLKTMSLKFKYL